MRDLLALEQEAADLDPSRVLGVLRRQWILVLLIPLLFAGVSGVLSARDTKRYEATADIVVRPTATDSRFAATDTGDADKELQTETAFIGSSAFAAQVAESLGRPASYRAGAVFGTSIIAVTGNSDQPTVAADIANAVAELYVKQRRDQFVSGLNAAGAVLTQRITALQGELDQLTAKAPANAAATDLALRARQDALTAQITSLRDRLSEIEIGVAVTSGGAQVLSPAVASSSPVAPRPKRTAVLFGALGVLVGIAAAFAVDQLRDRLGAEAFERRLPGVPLLATVPANGAAHHGLLLLQAPQSASAEAIRSLRTSLQFLSLDRPLRRLQITSSSDDEGASVIAANLAAAFAGAGLRVVVVDGDLRHPTLHTYFGADGMRGFMTVLVGRGDLDATLQPIAMQGWLRLLASGPRPTNPSEILASGHLSALLAKLEERCDLVIIDSPPVLPYTDAAVIASLVDATVVVARSRATKLASLRRALRTLRIVESKVAGVVVSDLEDPTPGAGRRGDLEVRSAV